MYNAPPFRLSLLLPGALALAGCTMGVVGTPEGGEASDDALTETRAWQCDPVPEHCDGLDNDCNGQVDEGCPCQNGDTQSCYSNDPTTEGEGVCAAGTQTCVNWQWGPCEGAIEPSLEACDGKDNNCDGSVDEGNPGGGSGCVTGQAGVCSEGIYVCTAGNLDCSPVQFPTAELCDGLDNNCDGSVDEGNPGGGAQCSTGQSGLCATGTLTCEGGTLQCAPNTQPTTEICDDGEDNDCDGTVDEDCGGGGGSCSHDKCVTGTPLASTCDLCVQVICYQDAYCCSTAWDNMCVSQVATVCGLAC